MNTQEFLRQIMDLRIKSKDLNRIKSRVVNVDPELIIAAMGACTEANEILDAVKKHLKYGKEIDPVNMKEEIGDILHYLSWICDHFNLTFEQCMEANIQKLKIRYPNGFEETRGINRDTKNEYGVLK